MAMHLLANAVISSRSPANLSTVRLALDYSCKVTLVDTGSRGIISLFAGELVSA